MTTDIPLVRRVALACVTLLLAGGLFHGQVAAALITRGDDALRNGDRTAGVGYYFRALAIDGRSRSAADRLAFYLAMRHAPGDAEAAIVIATRMIAHDGTDAALLADRGLAEQRLGRWDAAERDFGSAGSVGRDARYDHLAGRVALRLHDFANARHFFDQALVHDPAFHPARVALAHL